MVREFEKPLTMESMGKFTRSSSNHMALSQRRGTLNLTQKNHKELTLMLMAKEPCLVIMLTTITLAHQLDLPLIIELDRHTTSSYLEGNLPRLTTRALEQFREQAKQDQEQKHLKVAKKARMIWDLPLFLVTHIHTLISKGVKSHHLRVHKNRLLIPIIDETGKMWSLQTIFPRWIKKIFVWW